MRCYSELGAFNHVANADKPLFDEVLESSGALDCRGKSRFLQQRRLAHPKHVQKKREDFQMIKELSAECVGTFMLVASVCGAALFSAPNVGFMAVAFSIGIAVLAMAYAVGPISGAHFNPAVTCGLVAAGRFAAGKVVPYIIAQVLGGVAAAV